MNEILQTQDIQLVGRMREDYGDMDDLCSSIQEFGLIQPIVLAKQASGGVELVAGGRRLAALKRLGFKELEHSKQYIYRDEVVDGNESIRLKLSAIELEENLRRKEMTWSEVATGQKKLLELMQRIHGKARSGPRSASDKQLGTGFGVNQLASMLGVSPASVSQNIQLANTIEKMPELAKHSSAESARRKINILNVVSQMMVKKPATSVVPASVVADKATLSTTVQELNNSGKDSSSLLAAAPSVVVPIPETNKTAHKIPVSQKQWTLYETDFRKSCHLVADESVDLVYTDLPYGVDLNRIHRYNADSVTYEDSLRWILDMIPSLAKESYRILKPDRYCVFFFGLSYYKELCEALSNEGFTVASMPVIWAKNTQYSENPNTRYTLSYELAIYASKGNAVFIRPGRRNIKEIVPVKGQAKLQVAQQPVELVRDFLEDMTIAGATVVDFCAGTGTTGVACLENGRKAILFEKSAEQALIIKGRMAKF